MVALALLLLLRTLVAGAHHLSTVLMLILGLMAFSTRDEAGQTALSGGDLPCN